MLTNLIQMNEHPVRPVLSLLLQDKTTKKNIIWATDSYAALGAEYADDVQMTTQALIGMDAVLLQPRVLKAQSEQQERTKSHAEVFTPSWVCNQMNNFCDEEWFGRKDVFNTQDGHSWTANAEPVAFQKRRPWKHYVDSRRLEITCGETPFIVSRYDAATGEAIPLPQRIGLLDRKLRVVNENAEDEAEWLKWVFRAFQSVYGYEYQGDNLVLARINLLMTFAEYLEDRLRRPPTNKELRKLANIIAWNFWQMDGLKGTVPLGEPEDLQTQINMDDLYGAALGFRDAAPKDIKTPRCRVFDWRRDRSIPFEALGKESARTMKFDFVIGNPPYQEDKEGTSDKPVYDSFMDSAFKVSDKVELIHPARFLFNAGKTPKDWNKKKLSDEHLKVLKYYQDSSFVFPGTRITGGVAVTYRDAHEDFGAIEVFSHFEEIRTLSAKMRNHVKSSSLPNIMILQNRLNLNELYNDYPDLRMVISSDGNERRIVSSAFNKLPIFYANRDETLDMVAIFGLEGTGQNRTQKWVEKKYIEDNGNLYKYKIMVSKSNGGAGTLCDTPVRIVAEPFVLTPKVGYTQSFIGIGAFDTKKEADSALKYLKTKFVRCLLGILKITQDNPPEKWRFIPLQDFTPSSDIDWSLPIPEIDRQLYRKYALTDEEITFIETHVKEMS